MTSAWMGLQMRKVYLATRCGSPREYDSQYRRDVWSDPPRAVTVAEWIVFLDGWVQTGSGAWQWHRHLLMETR
jgi:hypothetical protein